MAACEVGECIRRKDGALQRAVVKELNQRCDAARLGNRHLAGWVVGQVPQRRGGALLTGLAARLHQAHQRHDAARRCDCVQPVAGRRLPISAGSALRRAQQNLARGLRDGRRQERCLAVEDGFHRGLERQRRDRHWWQGRGRWW